MDSVNRVTRIRLPSVHVLLRPGGGGRHKNENGIQDVRRDERRVMRTTANVKVVEKRGRGKDRRRGEEGGGGREEGGSRQRRANAETAVPQVIAEGEEAH
jgi:hypothetical protein